jgi:AAA domain
MKFTSVSQLATTTGIKCLVYGGSGDGKSVLTATLPAPIMISAEAGVLSLRRRNLERIFGSNNPSITYDMPVIEVSTVEDLGEAYTWAAYSPEAAKYESVALDSISEIAEVVLSNAKRQVKDPRQAYGELIDKMEMLVRAFRDLPNKNVVLISKMEYQKDEAIGIFKYVPSMPGAKLSNKLPYFFDEVFRLGINKSMEGVQYRFLQTQPDLQYVAKDRSGTLEPIEEPHLGKAFAKIQAEAPTESEPAKDAA